jgi:hypothetical protein
MRVSRLTRRSALSALFICASGLAIASCSGGGGGGGNSNGTPTQPTNNTPARVEISPAAPLNLVSGSTATLTATAFASDGRSLGASGITWASSGDGVASVASGLVTAKLVGSATITATAGSATASVVVSVTPGAAVTLALRAQPAGGASGAAFTTQPVVEIRDAAGNVVTSSTLAVSVTIASGGGTLTGTTTATAAAGVATFANLAISGLVGPRTLTFSAPGVQAATSSAFELAPGAPTALSIRTQPVAGTAYAAFTTPAVVDIRDAAGNVTSSTAAVTAAIASGGGALGGTATVNAVNGVATFTDLTVNGTAGARTLTFTSGTFAAVTTTSFNVAAAPPAVIGLPSATLAITAIRGSNPTSPSDVAITNTGVFPLTNLRAQSTTYNPLVPGNWLAVSFPNGTSAPATMRLTITSAPLNLGTYTAVIVIAGDGANATQNLTVTLTVVAALTNTYGTAANKVSVIAAGGALSPGLVTTAGTTVTTPDATVTYQSRSTSVATVDAAGRITAVSPGQSWVVANSAVSPSDSVLVIVTPTTGTVLRTDMTTWSYRVGDVISIKIQLDTRGASVGATTLTFTWPTVIGNTGVFGALTFVDVTAAPPLAPQSSFDSGTQVLRITGASSAGVTGLIDVATVRLRVVRAGASIAYVTAIEMLGPDLTNLLGTTTSTSYPIIVP